MFSVQVGEQLRLHNALLVALAYRDAMCGQIHKNLSKHIHCSSIHSTSDTIISINYNIAAIE